MSRYPKHNIEKARRLAADGLNFSQISQTLNINKTLISSWCKDLAFNTNALNNIKGHQSLRKNLLNSEIEFVENIIIDKNLAKIFCAILYGCEGSKYPASSGVALTNADPELINCFLTLLRMSYPITEKKLKVILQIHNNQNYKHLLEFWSKLLKIPSNQFYKPTITPSSNQKHRDKYLGTCTLKYYDYKIQLKLIGIFEAFMRKSSLQGGVA